MGGGGERQEAVGRGPKKHDAFAAPQGNQCTYDKQTGKLVGSGWAAMVGVAAGTTFLGPCPRSPTPAGGAGGAAAPSGASAPPPAPVGARLFASIASPSGVVPVRGSASASVVLDSAGTTAVARRPITSYVWTVRSRPTNATITTVVGPKATLDLPAGTYSASLVVRDSLGAESSDVRDFVVGDHAATTAVISSPRDLEPASAAGSTDGSSYARVALSAEGSGAGPGQYLVQAAWMVQRLPSLDVVGTPSGLTSYVTLPVVSGRSDRGMGGCVFWAVPQHRRAFARDEGGSARHTNTNTSTFTWPLDQCGRSNSSGHRQGAYAGQRAKVF